MIADFLADTFVVANSVPHETRALAAARRLEG
jgi:hypothetical protein